VLYLLVRRFFRGFLVLQFRGFRIFKLLEHGPPPPDPVYRIRIFCLTLSLLALRVWSNLLAFPSHLPNPALSRVTPHAPIPRVKYSAAPLGIQPFQPRLACQIVR
jgi:hypothetical protein